MRITAYSQPLRSSFKPQFAGAVLDSNQLEEFDEFCSESQSLDFLKLASLKKDTLILKAKSDDLAKQNEKIIEQNEKIKKALFQIAKAMNLEFQNPEAAKEAKFASYRVRD